MLINKNVLRALNLSQGETILMNIRPYRDKSLPEKDIKDIVKFRFITTERVVQLDYYFLQQTTRIRDILTFNKIIDLKLSMQHSSLNRDPLFYVAASKVPILEITSEDQTYTFSLRGILFRKKKINKLVDCIRRQNAAVNVSLNFKKDSMGEAYKEILFDNIEETKRPWLFLLLLVLVVILVVASWHVVNHLNEFVGH